jgi:hypothetical protein
MTRVLIGIATAWLLASPALASAAEPEIKTLRNGERATITLRDGGLTVIQRVTRTAVNLELVHADDIVQFSGDLDGRVAFVRGSKSRAYAVRTAIGDDRTATNALLAGSAALAAFDALLQSPWAQTAEAAVLFKSTREVIRVLQGEPGIADLLAARPAMAPAVASPVASIVPVRQRMTPSQCWDSYARDVIHFTYELQSCLNSASYSWWNPLATGWCAYEYNLKSSLASIWLLDCYGVPV